jgi:hypothetical protein
MTARKRSLALWFAVAAAVPEADRLEHTGTSGTWTGSRRPRS